MRYDVFLHPDGRAACPECGGMAKMTANMEHLRCHDCGQIFKVRNTNPYNEKTVAVERPDAKEDTK